MSRIDEALKRAAKSPAGTDSVPATRDRFALAAKPRVRVDDFAAEEEGAHSDLVSTPVDRRVKVESTPVDRRVKVERKAPATETPAARPPVARTQPLLARTSEVVDGKLVSLKGTDPTSVEQYRRLAATVHGLQLQNGIKILMVTSSVPREGKTLTSTNLALTLSQSYQRRVLLIDGDLRRPFVHQIFTIPNTAGLGDGLRGDGVSLPLFQVTPLLSILPAGRPDSDPMAGLASERMHHILKEAAEQFDWVILDTAPVGLITDANLMAGFVDGVIFVIGANSTNYQLVERSLNEIGRDRIIGTVLNRVEHEGTPAAGYYNHYYHDPDSSEDA